MKAIVQTRYGAPDLLEVREIARPVCGENEVLLSVRAAALNPLDWHTVRGLPYMLRIGNGFARPKKLVVPGVDVAGVVEAVGPKVDRLRPGDEVFGVCNGALAEIAVTRADRVVAKPARLSFEQAAAIPVAGLTALQGLRDRGRIAAGQKVLVVGAAGGVGTFAVQIARAFGVEVTGVCSAGKVELVRSLGADRVVDYGREDFTRSGRRYDLVLDMAGTHTLRACRRAMTPRGICVVVGAPSGNWFKGPDRFLKALLLSPFVGQKFLPFISAVKRDDLVALSELVEAGKVTPVIDRSCALHEAPAALRYVEEGHARGKVVVAL